MMMAINTTTMAMNTSQAMVSRASASITKPDAQPENDVREGFCFLVEIGAQNRLRDEQQNQVCPKRKAEQCRCAIQLRVRTLWNRKTGVDAGLYLLKFDVLNKRPYLIA